MIQDYARARHNDSKEPPYRFDCFNFQFHRARSATFATHSEPKQTCHRHRESEIQDPSETLARWGYRNRRAGGRLMTYQIAVCTNECGDRRLRPLRTHAPLMAAVLPPINEVIDLHWTHLAMARRHLPIPIMMVLLGAAAIGVGIIGFGNARVGRRFWWSSNRGSDPIWPRHKPDTRAHPSRARW